MLSDAELLKPFIVLEHFAEVDGNALADSLVHWVVNVQLYKGLIAWVEHRQYSYNSVMVDLVVTQIQRLQFIMRKQQLGNHHSAISFDLVSIQIKGL